MTELWGESRLFKLVKEQALNQRRDQFAMAEQSLPTYEWLVADGFIDPDGYAGLSSLPRDKWMAAVAKWRFEMADAMIKASGVELTLDGLLPAIKEASA